MADSKRKKLPKKTGSGRISENREQELFQILRDLKREERSISPEHDLWMVAKEKVSNPLQALFERIDRQLPSKIRSAEHWVRLVDHMEREAEEAAHILLSDSPAITAGPFARFIKWAADTNDWTLRAALETWLVEGTAIRDAVDAKNISLSVQRKQADADIFGVCELCWRSAARSERGSLFCAIHATFGPEYDRAMERREWQDPSQEPHDHCSFVWHWTRELRGRLPYALIAEPQDVSELAKLCRGEEVDLELVPLWRVELSEYWRHFPRTKLLLLRHPSPVDLNSAERVLRALDPAVKGAKGLQAQVHYVLARDHRLFFDRLIYVEACLEADLRRRRKKRPIGARPAKRDWLVVPYTFSYSYADYVRIL